MTVAEVVKPKTIKKTNKEILEGKMIGTDYVVGCYNDDMEKLSQKELQKVIEMMFEQYTDVKVNVRRKKYVVEIATVDNEIDFRLISEVDYQKQYGRCVGED